MSNNMIQALYYFIGCIVFTILHYFWIKSREGAFKMITDVTTLKHYLIILGLLGMCIYNLTKV